MSSGTGGLRDHSGRVYSTWWNLVPLISMVKIPEKEPAVFSQSACTSNWEESPTVSPVAELATACNIRGVYVPPGMATS